VGFCRMFVSLGLDVCLTSFMLARVWISVFRIGSVVPLWTALWGDEFVVAGST